MHQDLCVRLLEHGALEGRDQVMRAVASGIDGVLYTQVPGGCYHFHVEHSEKRSWPLTSDCQHFDLHLSASRPLGNTVPQPAHQPGLLSYSVTASRVGQGGHQSLQTTNLGGG